MPKYVAIMERVESGYSAYLPDVPGCIATGKTRTEAKKNIEGALRLHLEGLRKDREPIPEPRTVAETVAVE